MSSYFIHLQDWWIPLSSKMAPSCNLPKMYPRVCPISSTISSTNSDIIQGKYYVFRHCNTMFGV